MVWVGVRYRGVALPDIMKVMRLWLDQRHYEPRTFEYLISMSGTLVRVDFSNETEAAEFADAFAGLVSRERPSIGRPEGMEVAETAMLSDPDG